ncbi:MAG: YceI family protein [Bacteroidales bacterium]
MKKTIRFIVLLALVLPLQVRAQGKYLTNEGKIRFYSHTAIEDIAADNAEVAAVIDSKTGDVAVIVKMKSFHFEKSLMEEHFNENYVESDTYPKATFNGTIVNNTAVDYGTPGTYAVTVEGKMSIHNTVKTVRTEGTVTVSGSGIRAHTGFLLNPEDYGITIPRVVRKNLAENMEITVELDCKPL